MQIIALINQKGGVEKTACAINIRAGLDKLRKRVMLVNLDPQKTLAWSPLLLFYPELAGFSLETDLLKVFIMKKTKTYMDKLMENKEFREKFDKEYRNLCVGEKIAGIRHRANLRQDEPVNRKKNDKTF